MNTDKKECASSCCSLPSLSFLRIITGLLFGALTGLTGFTFLVEIADIISTLFVNFLRLVSLPMIFLSIIATISGMESSQSVTILGKRVVGYTLLTTLLSASIALGLFLWIDPASSVDPLIHEKTAIVQVEPDSYKNFLLETVPNNFIKPFLENQVTGVLFLALTLSFAMLSLPAPVRAPLKGVIDALYACVMAMTKGLLSLMPLAVFAFSLLLVHQMEDFQSLTRMGWYLLAVLGANVVQGFVILPLLLLFKGVSPLGFIREVMPALMVAFFTKSSAATLPIAMRSVEKAGVSSTISRFTMPLCTTINMNGCAAFILITVLFVGSLEGLQLSFNEMLLWIPLATIAAVGNAGVPMGCFFLSSAFLASLGVPLYWMGVILPFYTIVDMVETALNVFSDCVVARVVQSDLERPLAKARESQT